VLSDSRSTRDMSIIFSKGSDTGQSEPLSVTDNLHNQTEEEKFISIPPTHGAESPA
jgi:hypothetical protein